MGVDYSNLSRLDSLTIKMAIVGKKRRDGLFWRLSVAQQRQPLGAVVEIGFELRRQRPDVSLRIDD